VMRTLSTLGLAGIRLGYAVGRPEWIREFDKVRSPYNVNTLTHVVAERILAHHDVLDAQARNIIAERQRLDAELRKLPRTTVFPSDANFILVRVPDAKAVFEGMRRRGVLVKNLDTGVPLLQGCVRLTIGMPEENVRCLAAFSQPLADSSFCVGYLPEARRNADARRQSRPQDRGNADRAVRQRRRQRPRDAFHRHPFPRSHARPGRAARDARPRYPGEGRPAGRRPPHRGGYR